MKTQTTNALVSDLLIIIGGVAAIVAMWLMNWQAGMLGTGLGLIVVGGVLRGVELVQGGRRRR